ncbi:MULTISPECIES: GAF domain-containing protein [unclassified Pseudomonas]|uniref:GAF domain-containing protein n=1 Tax=unclassified Pseudomonas TaxID=196821 RepID=UPI0030D6D5D0
MQNGQSEIHTILTPDECSAIAEIEATTSILSIVTRMTQMRFAAIAKYDNTDWVVCSVHDTGELGISAGDTLPVEITLCSDFLTDPRALLLPDISKSLRHRTRPVVKQYGLESYVGVPIILPDGSLYGALCALDSKPVAFENPDLADTLQLFARLIGCIFFGNGRSALR